MIKRLTLIPLLTLLFATTAFAQAEPAEPPEEVSIEYRTYSPHGFGVKYEIGRDHDGIYLIRVRQNIRAPKGKQVIKERFVVTLAELRHVWKLVKKHGLETFEAKAQGGEIPADYNTSGLVITISKKDAIKGTVHSVSWSRPIKNGKGVGVLANALNIIALRHERPAVRPDLSHVEVGQRYHYSVTRGGVEIGRRVLTVIEVNAASVRFHQEGGAPQIWRLSDLTDLELTPDTAVTVDGVSFDVRSCRIPSMGYAAGFSFRKGKPTFPDSVWSVERDKKVRLAKIEQPKK